MEFRTFGHKCNLLFDLFQPLPLAKVKEIPSLSLHSTALEEAQRWLSCAKSRKRSHGQFTFVCLCRLQSMLAPQS